MNLPCAFSPCGKYRYTLFRDWRDRYHEVANGLFDPYPQYYPGTKDSFVMFIGLNPSTADDKQDDPTIRRCRNFAKTWGFGSMAMTNLFAFRATKPDEMKRQVDPIGPDNDRWLKEVGSQAGLVVAAWGRDGKYRCRDETVIAMFPKLHIIRQNLDGSPEHPLYIPGLTMPTRFRLTT